MKKIYLTILAGSLLAPIAALAALGDFTLGASAKITIGGITLDVVGVTADMIVVDSSSFDVGMSPGASIEVSSTDRRRLDVTEPGSITAGLNCSTSASTYTITNPSNNIFATTTVTMTSDTCAASGGGGGGGGGGTSAASVKKVAVATPAASSVATPSAVAQAVSPVFNRALKIGTSGADVKRLQQLLNSDPDTRIAVSGVGSSGNETEYFGLLLQAAVKKFQAKYGIVSSGSPETTGFGAVGPGTRAKLAEVFAKATPTAPSVATPSAVAQAVSPVFNRGLGFGVSAGADVKRLQQVLNSDPDTKITASGAGSPGSETETFGRLTEAAVKKFQEKYGIAKAGDAGYGYVGPKTRAKLEEVGGGASASATPAVTPTTAGSSGGAEAALQKQINDALKQIQDLQAKLKAQLGQ